MIKVYQTLKSGVMDFFEDECMVSGAALAYYTIFSLPPLLALVMFIAGLFGVERATINQVVSRQIGMPVPSESQLTGERNSVSEKSADEKSAVAEAKASGAWAWASKIIGGAILIFSATGLFAQLQSALNRAWEVEPDPEQGGWKSFIAKRGLSLGMVVVIAFLLLVSLVMTTLVDELVALVVGSDGGALATTVGILLNNAVVLMLATLLFATMYKILPDAEMRLKDMWVGSFITAALFIIGKFAIGWYLQNSDIGSAWGSAATSMIALLVWVYYTSIIVLLGAELTQSWAKNYGHGITPEAGAVRTVRRKEHQRDTSAS